MVKVYSLIIKRAKVVRSDRGPDTIMLIVAQPDPAFPFNPDEATMTMTAAAGEGADYVRMQYGMEPEIVG